MRCLTLAFAIATLIALPRVRAQGDTVLTVTEIQSATAYADSLDLAVLAVFAGSDWCRPCKMFKRAVLDEPSFREGAASDVVVLYLDFPAKRRNALPPRQTAHNEALAERFNPTGSFPKLVLLRPDESLVGELDYAGQDAATFLAEMRAARGLDGEGR